MGWWKNVEREARRVVTQVGLREPDSPLPVQAHSLGSAVPPPLAVSAAVAPAVAAQNEIPPPNQATDGFSMATSNFLRIHSETPDPKSYPDVIFSMEKLVFFYGKKFGVPDVKSEEFSCKLRNEAKEHDSGVAAMLANLDQLATRLWTSSLLLRVGIKDVGLHNMIQYPLIHDDPEMLALAMPLIRGINMMCVNRRSKSSPPIPWESEVFRGSSLPEEHARFFLGAVGRKLRFKTFVACSTKKDVVLENFMRPIDPPHRALWKIRLHPEFRCFNVNYLEPVSAADHEHEFLFPPYSVFTVEGCRFDDEVGFYMIDLFAAVDNRAQPNDLEVAPWG